MVKRLTDKPVLQKISLAESAANTYTEEQISLPAAVIGANKMLGTEIMGFYGKISKPSAEIGQHNFTTFEIHRSSNTTANGGDETNRGLFDADLIQRVSFDIDMDDEGAENGAPVFSQEEFYPAKPWLENPHEEGVVVSDRLIYAHILGLGNDAPSSAVGWMLYYPVELNEEDLAQIQQLQFFQDT